MKRLGFLLIALIALTTLGCGSSRDDYVYSTSAGSRDITFQFATPVPAQMVLIDRLRFEFFPADVNGEPDLDHGLTPIFRQYAETVTVENIDSKYVYVVVTAVDTNDLTVAVVANGVPIAIGASGVVDLRQSSFTPVNRPSLVVNPNGVILLLEESGAFTPRELLDTSGFTVKAVDGSFSTAINASAITFGTNLVGTNAAKFSFDTNGKLTVDPAATEGDWCAIPLSYTSNGKTFTGLFKVVVGPRAFVEFSNDFTVAAAGDDVPSASISYGLCKIDGSAYVGDLSFTELKAQTGYSDISLVSSNPDMVTIGTDGTIHTTATLTGKVFVWIMKGDLLSGYLTVAVAP